MILLDRTSEQYMTLNFIAADIWEWLAAGTAPSAIVDRLCMEYDAPREQVAADVARQLDEFVGNGLIEPGRAPFSETAPVSQLTLPVGDQRLSQTSPQPPPAPADIREPSYLRCARMIAVVKLHLATQGYERTLGWIRRQVELVPATEQSSIEAIRVAEYRVAMVAALYPGRVQCLERSLALYCLLRKEGVAVRYWSGAQPYPFEAHAWLEYRGEVVNDVPEHVKQFARLPEQLP